MIDEKRLDIDDLSKSGYMATAIVNRYGIAPTVRGNHGQVTAVIEEVYKRYENRHSGC